MKNIKKLITILSFIVLFTCFCAKNLYAQSKQTVDILFTSDLHSYIESYDQEINGQQMNVGGFARLKSLIDEKKAENENLLLVDDGDVVMGTLPQALMSTDAYELRFLSQFAFDAATIGNHEFDYGAKSLSSMFSVAAKSNSVRPAYVICNIDWNQNDEYTNTLKEGLSEYGYADYVVIEKDGVRIAITGVLGIDAQKCASSCQLTFIDPIEAVKKTVAEIKSKENPDMIVCLSHSGTGTKLGKTEDELLAKAVPDLDVIVSGHTHTLLKDCLQVGDTYILSCGAYGLYTGEGIFTRKDNGRWNIDSYEVILMDSSIEEDDIVLAQVRDINSSIDEKVLKGYGYKADQVIAINPGISFESVDDVYDLHTETKLGSLLSDAYRCMSNSTPTGQEHPFDIAVAPSGTIRGTFVNGEITVAKAFEALSLGEGQDGLVGYPLVNFYITGKEIRTMTEVDASISDIMTSARLYTSGVCFEYNPLRPLLNKVSDTWLCTPLMEDSRTEIEEDKMYRVVTDYYTMTMLGAVTDLSKGILSIIPKDENGNPVTDYNQRLIYDAEGNELKAWTALARYLDSFSEDGNGVSVIPDYYRELHNRKVVNKTLNPIKYFKNAGAVIYIVLILIIAIVLIVVLVVRAIKKRGNKKKVLYQ